MEYISTSRRSRTLVPWRKCGGPLSNSGLRTKRPSYHAYTEAAAEDEAKAALVARKQAQMPYWTPANRMTLSLGLEATCELEKKVFFIHLDGEDDPALRVAIRADAVD
eukprot:scaffold244716_cov24-Tisochrysis_lutea.AAC.1